MRNFGKRSRNLSALEIQIHKDFVNALLVLYESFGKKAIAVMVLADNINQPNIMKGITTFNAKNATASRAANKPSTKKKSKKGTAKEHGIKWSSPVIPSVKGVRSRSK